MPAGARRALPAATPATARSSSRARSPRSCRTSRACVALALLDRTRTRRARKWTTSNSVTMRQPAPSLAASSLVPSRSRRS